MGMELGSSVAVGSISLGERGLVGSPYESHTSDQRAAFATCEELIHALFRIGATDVGHPERYAFFTDDVELHIYDPMNSKGTFALIGKPEVIRWFEEQDAARGDGFDGCYARVHSCSNFIWRSISETEIRSYNYVFYYEFRADNAPPLPSAVVDATHEFRLEDGVWKIARRHYWMVRVDKTRLHEGGRAS